MLEEGHRKSPRDRWDPDYVVGMVGREPRQLFGWVRDNTYWIPYRGVLRGPVGVLMDGQGNSLDRALLLATLLAKAGHSTRLAHGELTREQAVALLPGLVARQTVFAGVRTIETRSVTTRASSRLDARVSDQAGRLLHVIGRPDVRKASDAAFDAALAALRDHWWVQQKVGEGWVDFDPLAQAAATSSPLAAVKDTLSLEELAGRSLHHEIVVRVIAEQWSDGVATERKSLEHVLRPADLVGQPVVLQFWPTEWPADLAPPFVPKADIRSALLDQREWAAVLTVGQEIAATGVLGISGDDPDAPVRGGAFAALAAGGADAFRSSSKRGTTNSSGKTLSAVWLEYEFRVPGETSRTIRRAVFDLIGPAARARGRGTALQIDEAMQLTRSRALMMRTQMLPLGSAVAPEFVADLVTANLLGNKDLLRSGTRAVVTPASTPTEDPARAAVPAVSSLYAWALARQQGSEARFEYIDRPTLLTSHAYPILKSPGVATIDAIDVVANEVGVSVVARDAFAVRLAQGVRDTNAEAVVRRQSLSFGNAGEAFAKSSAWVTLASLDSSAVDRLKLPDDTRRRIVEDLTAGYVVVAPEAAIPMTPEPFAGWWRIDPATGHALGIGGNGWGVEMAENTGGVARGARLSPFFKRLMLRAAIGFEAGYGWCIVPKVTEYLDQWAFSLSGALTDQEECLELGGVFAVLATIPFLIGEVRAGSCATGRVPPEPPIAGGPPEPVVIRPGAKDETLPMGNAKTVDPSLTQGGRPPSVPEPTLPQPRTPPQTVADAADNLAKANARKIAANAEAQKAWEDSLQYRGRHRLDPTAPWDPAEDKQLADFELQKDREYRQSYLDWQQAQRDLRDLQGRQNGACGRRGFPSPNGPSK